MTDAAIGIIFNAIKTEVLVIKRCDIAMWVLPSGGIDTGETPEEAVVREVKEETGFDVKITRQIAEYSPLNRLSAPTFVFECTIIGGEASLSSETCEVGFHSINNLPHPFFHVHRDWLHDALLNDPCVIRKSIEQVTYLKLFFYFLRHPIQVLQALKARLHRT